MKSGIGEFLSILRKSKGLTQQEVADALGVSNKTVSSWETGASCPDIGMLPAIAELFGVTCDELLRGERLPAAEPGARTEEKREKALARMLARLKNAAAISCWVSAGLYVVALVVTLLIGSAASESLIGFFVGLLFVLGGVFVNLIHYKSLRYQLPQDDFESAAVDDCHCSALSVRQTVVLLLASRRIRLHCAARVYSRALRAAHRLCHRLRRARHCICGAAGGRRIYDCAQSATVLPHLPQKVLLDAEKRRHTLYRHRRATL